MKTEGAEVRSCEGEALASRRNTRRDEDGLGDLAMMGKRAFKRDVAPWHQDLRDGEGVRGFTAKLLVQYIDTPLDADQIGRAAWWEGGGRFGLIAAVAASIKKKKTV